MSAETRSKIEEVIKETDYVPNPLARSLNDKRSNLIGVMLQSLDSLDKERFLEGIEDYLNKNEYQMILTFSNSDLEEERRQLEKMKALNVDGYIISPSENFDLLWKAMKNTSPLVVYNPAHVSPYTYWIRSNDYEVVYDVLEKAADAGYTRFVMVSEELAHHALLQQRSRAFDDLTSLRHLEAESVYPADDEDLDYQLTRQIRIDEPTCFFVTSASMLRKVYLALRRYHSQMPDHIGLIGFNALEWSDMVSPSVSTIVQPSYQAGVQAAKLLLDVILGQNQELPTHIYQCEFHQADSTLPVLCQKQSENEEKDTS